MDEMKMQPIIVITPQRVECADCKALAVFFVYVGTGDDGIEYYRYFCQPCYSRVCQGQKLGGRQE